MSIFQIEKFILIFVRVVSFIAICPAFSYKAFPNTVKIAFSAIIAILVYSFTPPITVTENLIFFSILVIRESLFGLTIGYITKIIFSSVQMAGQMVDFQIGYSMAAVYDPSVGSRVSNYGRLYYWLSLSIMFILNLHHNIIQALMDSFNNIPIGSMFLNTFNINYIIMIFIKVFQVAFQIATPMIIVVLIADVVMGLISKTVPQINVLMLGMPIKSLIGFLMMLVLISTLINIIGNTLLTIPDYIEKAFTYFK